MNWETILYLTRQGEGYETKFFGSLETEDELGPTLTAMANTKGGAIIIGFDVRNYHLVGTTLDESWVNALIQRYCMPKLKVTVNFVEKNDKKLMVLTILKTSHKPYYYKNKCYVLNLEKSTLSIMENDAAPLPEVMIDDSSQPLTKESSEPESIDTDIADGSADASYQEGLYSSIKETDRSSQPQNSQSDSAGDSVGRIKPSLYDDSSTVSGKNSESEEQTIQHITHELLELTESISEDDAQINLIEQLDQSSSDKKSSVNESLTIKSDDSASFGASELGQPDSSSVSSKPPVTLNKRQEDALMYLTKHPFIKNSTYRDLFSVSHKTAHLELVNLVRQQLIVSQGSGRSTCYVLNAPIQQPT